VTDAIRSIERQRALQQRVRPVGAAERKAIEALRGRDEACFTTIPADLLKPRRGRR
jgi:hypothetical protein